MGGAGAMFATSFGFWGLDGAFSDSVDFGQGFFGHAAYELANFQLGDGVHRSIRLSGEYRSENFAGAGASGPPDNKTMASLAASYSQDLPWELSGGLSGTYSIGRASYGDSYGASANLGRSFGTAISAGMSVGYDVSTNPASARSAQDGVHASARLSYRLDEKSGLETAYDTRDGRNQLTYHRQEGSGAGSWSMQAGVDRTPGSGGEDQYGVNGSASYAGNRADVSVSHYASADGLNTRNLEQRTSATVGTAIAFADGKFATGRPVSNSFAIVAPHASLPESTVAIGSQESARAASGMFGPALVNDLGAYSQARLPVDVSNLPPGYDLGAGGFELYAPYKGGYRLTAGSDYSVTVIGTLLNARGEPVSLVTGDAYEEEHKDGRHVEVFTNRAGKFNAQGMRPGRWVIEMVDDAKSRFMFNVPESTTGLMKLGTVKPVKGTE
jgi:outer membrane usher protein